VRGSGVGREGIGWAVAVRESHIFHSITVEESHSKTEKKKRIPNLSIFFVRLKRLLKFE